MHDISKIKEQLKSHIEIPRRYHAPVLSFLSHTLNPAIHILTHGHIHLLHKPYSPHSFSASVESHVPFLEWIKNND